LGRLPGKKSLWNRKELTTDVLRPALIKQVPYTVFPGERPSWMDTLLTKLETNILGNKLSPVEALKRAQDDADKQWKILPPKWIVERKLKNSNIK
jgi:hypothetical protein